MQRYYYLVDKTNEQINFDSFNYLQNTYDIKISFIKNNKNIKNFKGKKIEVKTSEKVVLKGKGHFDINHSNEYVFFSNSLKKHINEIETTKDKVFLNYFFDTKEPIGNEDKSEENGKYYLPLKNCCIERIEKNDKGWKMELIFDV